MRVYSYVFVSVYGSIFMFEYNTKYVINKWLYIRTLIITLLHDNNTCLTHNKF